MSPRNPRWQEFADRLSEACNMREDEDEKAILWECDDTLNGAARVLRDMGASEPDVLLTMMFFAEHGAGCDCEVLLNVGPEFVVRCDA